ncbi:Polyketide cyclase / dehydrase and lipid transport [Nannocystis exedens]|uniref:Polyketide cyclase / dehydrase and lipid transport n=1 Tax=Nannocystis exedens TaxID=54 RepID=A0A1I1V9R9_9BACT|nr:SRPBCC family protein [Nannocystis exedens]PCC72470.1 Polyketide cyclase / dehydrase and lipid transport [Nannocystis exedens]SFD79717.1 Polyketide cyclase / dehydrase and lipid transport [Nannocystis exedens]
MPRRVLRVVFWLLGVFVLITVGGLFMPRQHIAMESVVLPAAPEVVYAAVRDVESQPSWRSDLKRVELLPDKGDRRVYREIGDDGVNTFEITEDVPNERFVSEMADPGRSFAGHWVFQFAPAEGGGTRLTLTEVGDVPNPALRFLAGAIFGWEGATKQYLADLQAHLAKS